MVHVIFCVTDVSTYIIINICLELYFQCDGHFGSAVWQEQGWLQNDGLLQCLGSLSAARHRQGITTYRNELNHGTLASNNRSTVLLYQDLNKVEDFRQGKGFARRCFDANKSFCFLQLNLTWPCTWSNIKSYMHMLFKVYLVKWLSHAFFLKVMLQLLLYWMAK